MAGRVSTRSTAGSAASSTARAISSPRSPPERTEEADMDDPKQKQTQRAAAVEAIRKRLQAYDRDGAIAAASGEIRSEEHTSELQSLMSISYAVFCLNKKNKTYTHTEISLHRDIKHRTQKVR